MPVYLRNLDAEAVVLPERGAFISSFRIRAQTQDALQETLWIPEEFKKNSSEWPGGGIPLCFPFAGRQWANGQVLHYRLQDNTFAMPLHGFAFSQSWAVLESHSESLSMLLTDSDVSKRFYPFGFRVIYTIQLRGLSLSLQLSVECIKAYSSASSMPIAVGFHPYFAVGQMASLSTSAKRYFTVTSDGGVGDGFNFEESPLDFHHPLSKSVILTSLSQQKALLCLDNYDIDISFDGSFKNIVLWQLNSKPFWCVEPWMSPPDALSQKCGLVWVKPGSSFTCSMSLQVVTK